MNEVLAQKIRKVLNDSEMAKKIAGKFCAGGDSPESIGNLLDNAIPNLILTTFQNSRAKQLEDLAKEHKADPIDELIADMKDLHSCLKPILTEHNDNAMQCAIDTLKYYHEIAETLKVFLAVMYVRGYIQKPNN